MWKVSARYTLCMTTALRCFDADQHYYETADAFTRFLDPKFAKRSVQWADLDGATARALEAAFQQRARRQPPPAPTDAAAIC